MCWHAGTNSLRCNTICRVGLVTLDGRLADSAVVRLTLGLCAAVPGVAAVVDRAAVVVEPVVNGGARHRAVRAGQRDRRAIFVVHLGHPLRLLEVLLGRFRDVARALGRLIVLLLSLLLLRLSSVHNGLPSFSGWRRTRRYPQLGLPESVIHQTE